MLTPKFIITRKAQKLNTYKTSDVSDLPGSSILFSYPSFLMKTFYWIFLKNTCVMFITT